MMVRHAYLLAISTNLRSLTIVDTLEDSICGLGRESGANHDGWQPSLSRGDGAGCQTSRCGHRTAIRRPGLIVRATTRSE